MKILIFTIINVHKISSLSTHTRATVYNAQLIFINNISTRKTIYIIWSNLRRLRGRLRVASSGVGEAPTFAFPAPQQANRCPIESNIFPQLSFHESLVRIREQFWVVAKKHKRRRSNSRLRGVIDSALLVRLGRRRLPQRRLLDDGV